VRRYRKGQIWRPPTAAESAANADALEGFRRQPETPSPPKFFGTDMVVKTPTGGIEARSGTTLKSAICTRCIETTDAEEKTLIETDEQIRVFNLYPDAVTGSVYVITSLTVCGTRYVSGEPC